MDKLNTQSAELYLARLKRQCREKEHIETMWHSDNRQVARIHTHCLTLDRGMDTRPARMFLRKWHEDADRCEISGKIAYAGVQGDERAQAIDYLEDMTNLVGHIDQQPVNKSKR